MSTANEDHKEPKVCGPFSLRTIVISQPKNPDAARKSMTPDPRKPTAQAPEMVVRARINILMQNPNGTGTLLSEKEALRIFRQFVVKNRHRFPDDHTFALEPGIAFWTVEGVPELAEFCPDHPGQKENFCGYDGRPADISLKTT